MGTPRGAVMDFDISAAQRSVVSLESSHPMVVIKFQEVKPTSVLKLKNTNKNTSCVILLCSTLFAKNFLNYDDLTITRYQMDNLPQILIIVDLSTVSYA